MTLQEISQPLPNRVIFGQQKSSANAISPTLRQKIKANPPQLQCHKCPKRCEIQT